MNLDESARPTYIGTMVKTSPRPKKKQGVCHIVALPFTFFKYLNGKRRIMETQIFHHTKI
jgi:hypothetical protein